MGSRFSDMKALDTVVTDAALTTKKTIAKKEKIINGGNNYAKN